MCVGSSCHSVFVRVKKFKFNPFLFHLRPPLNDTLRSLIYRSPTLVYMESILSTEATQASAIGASGSEEEVLFWLKI